MLELIDSLFGTSDLYKVLNISKENAQDTKKLRSAYLKAALVYHPDKAKEDEKDLHTKKFQILSKIIEVLQDDDLRKSYNETGEWPEDEKFNLSDANFKMSKAEFIAKYDEFKAAYQGSDEEASDIQRLYKEGDGNLVHIIDNLFCAEFLTDEERINSIINDLIKRKKLKRVAQTPAQERELKRRKTKAAKEAKEAEALQEELGLPKLNSTELEQQILARRETSHNSFLDDLEARYCKPAKGKAGKGAKPKGK